VRPSDDRKVFAVKSIKSDAAALTLQDHEIGSNVIAARHSDDLGFRQYAMIPEELSWLQLPAMLASITIADSAGSVGSWRALVNDSKPAEYIEPGSNLGGSGCSGSGRS